MKIALLTPDPSDALYAPYGAPYIGRYRMELEAIERDIYLEVAPTGGPAWARAIVESLP